MKYLFFILIVLLSMSTIRVSAQTTLGYKYLDSTDWTDVDTIEFLSGYKFLVFYKNLDIRKVVIDRIGNSSFTSIFYLKDNLLDSAKLAAFRYPGPIITEDHLYFSEGEMIKWVNTKGKEVNNKTQEFSDKEAEVKIAFNEIMIQVKNQKH